MELNEHNPSQINSFYEISNLQTIPFDLCKKRKLPAEHLGLPSPKHKHCNEAERANVQIIKGNMNVVCFDEASIPESIKDSNSFGEESDSATSVFCGGKFELNQHVTCTYDGSSTQSMSFGGTGSESTLFSVESSSTAMESSSSEQEVSLASGENKMETIQQLQGHLLEVGHEDYECAEYNVNDDIEQCTDQELEDLLNSNGLNPNAYVLSSGRWNVNNDAQSTAKTPTIDQEFEQYFSMLML